MNSDYRITTDAQDHPKLIKLKRIHGPEGVLCLFQLWAFTARYHCKGVLQGCTAEDIEIACRWVGNEGTFINALIDCRLLDLQDDVYSVHNWELRNAYCFRAPERSAQAKHAVDVREKKRSSDRSSQRSSPLPSPLPSPVPVPKENNMPQPSVAPKPSSGNSKPKRKRLPIEEREAKSDGAKAVKYWHVRFLEIHKIRYTGNIVLMQSQTKKLLERNPLARIVCSMNYLLTEKTNDNYSPHTFDHYVKRSSLYMVEADEAGYTEVTS